MDAGGAPRPASVGVCASAHVPLRVSATKPRFGGTDASAAVKKAKAIIFEIASSRVSLRVVLSP